MQVPEVPTLGIAVNSALACFEQEIVALAVQELRKSYSVLVTEGLGGLVHLDQGQARVLMSCCTLRLASLMLALNLG